MPSETVQFEDFELDRSACELRRGGSVVHLERIPFDLLNLLIERHGQVVTRQEILEQIWGKDVFVDADNSINTAIRKIRQALHDNLDAPRFVVTVPARGYRFVASVQKALPEPLGITSANHEGQELSSPTATREMPKRRWRNPAWAALIVAIVATAAIVRFYRAPALTEKDTIVIADFANTTGEPVFSDALKQGLSVQLEQSPFLNILSDKRVGETLQMMGLSPDEQVNEKTALEICQRTRSAAVIAGTVAMLGSDYVIGLNAVDCRTGDFLAKEQARATGRDQVLKAMDTEAKKLRERLGESRSSIQKFGTPIEQATTPSLEALQAYSLGYRKLLDGDDLAAVSFYRTAISLDPNFAMAYARLATSYSNLWELNLAKENTKRAYDLREKVSEREKFYIESHYHMFVTGSVEKGRQTLELWAQVYPRDSTPAFNLGEMYSNMGQYDKALENAKEALRLDPESGLNYATLIYRYSTLNRFNEAQNVADEAQAKKFDSAALHVVRYQLAFLQNNSKGMASQVAWATNKPGMEDVLLAFEADSAAYFGLLKNARELSRRAVFSAEAAGKKETARGYETDGLLREALLGNIAEVRAHLPKARGIATGDNEQFAEALPFVIVGDTTIGLSLADDLVKNAPEDTFAQFIQVPTIRAQIALAHRDPVAAIEAFRTASPFELGDLGFARLYPVYLRGQAYLANHQGNEAAIDFQKILDHRGVVGNGIIGALAHLGLARAYVLSGDTTKARAAYQDFLELWKDADPDIPILIAAKSEYARLR